MANCLLCASADLEKVQDQVLDIASVGRCELSFVVCRRCGLLHQNPLVAPELLTKHYEQFSNYTIADPEAARQAPPSSQTTRLMALQRDAFPAARSVYEIGAAAGIALNAFKRQGFTVSGCDPSHTATTQAMDIFGIKVDRTDAEHAAPHVAPFDIGMDHHTRRDPPRPGRRRGRAVVRRELQRHHLAACPLGRLRDPALLLLQQVERRRFALSRSLRPGRQGARGRRTGEARRQQARQ